MTAPVSDPLAATETDADARPSRPELPAVGRYRIDRVLGKGAMGTVYAAYDPALERAVALKVLHGEPDSTSHQRLLREARAMARLNHPNIVTVYEVSATRELDYVVMELVDGGTLHEWLREPRRTRREKLEALLEAGRGLAAAHEAGLVHRDFKPHNVLRSRSGRILVTDFGLARGDGRASDPAIAPVLDAAISATGSNLSDTLTHSGALLGTPAYMAPEQYHDTAVTPAADQFSFCVAVWEALAGQRPFHGTTLYEQRLAIDRGPDPATAARIPRRLRAILLRGLAVDPAARWPSLAPLLEALRPRVPRAALALGGVAVVAAGLAVWQLGARGEVAVPGCDAAEAELAAYHASPARATLLARGADGAGVVAPLDRLAADWATVQREACAAPEPAVRARQLACLDVVRGELALAVDVAAHVGMDLRDVDAASSVGDPRACRTSGSRVAPGRDERALALARFLSEELPAGRWPAEVSTEAPCPRAAWHLARATQAAFDGDRPAALRTAAEHAELCGDDRLRAVIAVITAELAAGNPFGLTGALHRAELAVQRAGDERLLGARVQLLRAIALSIDDQLDAAITEGLAAMRTLEELRAHTAVVIATSLVVDLLDKRRTAADYATAERLLRAAIPHAGPRSRVYLVPRLAMALWHQGKHAEAHRLGPELEVGIVPDAITVRGRVVDRDDRPVAGARIVAATRMAGDARAVAISADREARSDASGAFELTGVARYALVSGELGVYRSRPARAATTALELRLEPTGSITGRVARTGDVGVVHVHAAAAGHEAARWTVLAAVAADGTFRIDGVPRGPAQVVASAADGRTVGASVVVGEQPAAVELALAAPSAELVVLVRSQVEGRLLGAHTYVLQGRVAPRTLGELTALASARVTRWARPPDARAEATLRGVLAPGDLVARARVLAGEVTACAVPLGDLDDPAYAARLDRHFGELEVQCVTTVVTEPAASVVVPVGAMKRLPD